MQLENDCICSVPEYVGVANRLGKKISDVIIGTLNGDEKADKELLEWCKIAAVLRALHGARIGLMGHVLEAMESAKRLGVLRLSRILRRLCKGLCREQVRHGGL